MSEHTTTVSDALSLLVAGRVADVASPASILAARSGVAEAQIAAAGDAGDGSAPDKNTVFRIASCTKSFTAARTLQLRDAGRLDLDRPVAEILPRAPRFLLPGVGGPEPTPRMLLTMSAGLPTDNAWADRLESMSPDAFDALLGRGVRFVRRPGTGYEYANLGWAILGRALEHVDGRPLQRQIERELLAPLGLTGVRFSAPAERRTAIGFAWRSDGWEPQPVTAPGAFSAIGGLFASAADLLEWTSWLASAWTEHHNGDPVLSAASRREMQQLHRTNTEQSGVVSGYGYGLVVEHSPELGHVVAHSGGYPGFSAHMRWSAEHPVAVCGLENAGYSGVHLIARKAFAGLMGDAPTGWLSDPWDETRTAVARLSALVDAHDDPNIWDRAENSLFDPCVALDLPLGERRARLAGVIHRAGAPLRHGPASFPTPASARWQVRGPLGCFDLSLQMTPSDPPRVQRFDVSPNRAEASYDR